jgi:hypothetical protein
MRHVRGNVEHGTLAQSMVHSVSFDPAIEEAFPRQDVAYQMTVTMGRWWSVDWGRWQESRKGHDVPLTLEEEPDGSDIPVGGHIA